jgi:exopolyphosphatase/guanosine-5'-triphosphate,3'-diphosphate pyrophosphatase
VRRACIDIGSNTTRLLVADCGERRIEEIHEERAFTHLALGREADDAIAPEKLAEVAALVAAQLETARRLGCGEVRAVATAAIRRAANGQALAAAVRQACGLEVEILTGEEEARLAFRGAARAFRHLSGGELGVVDGGGGSTELAVGQVPDRVRWSVSLPFGSGDLARTYLHSDPPSAAELAKARDQLASVFDNLDVPRPAEAAAVGKSAASLARVGGRVLGSAAFARALGEVVAAPRQEVAARFELDVERVRLLPAGLLILEAVSERFGVPLVFVGGGIREGVLMEAAGAPSGD